MVRGSAIRHLAASNRNDVFLAALFDRIVFVWDIIKGRKIAEHDTFLDFGGRRLALASSKNVFVAGAYERFGIACHGLFNGDRLWHRKDLKGVQRIQISPDDRFVFCGFSDKPGQILDIDSGITLEKLRGVRDITYDSYESWIMYDRDAQPEVFDNMGHSQVKIKRNTFAILHSVFSPNHVALTESGGPVRFISRKDPDKAIYYHPPKGQHVLRLAYSARDGVFYGTQWNYEEGGETTLLKFDLSLDNPTTIADVGSNKAIFCNFGEYIISSDGLYMRTLTGEIEKRFDFPLEEYKV